MRGAAKWWWKRSTRPAARRAPPVPGWEGPREHHRREVADDGKGPGWGGGAAPGGPHGKRFLGAEGPEPVCGAPPPRPGLDTPPLPRVEPPIRRHQRGE